MHPHASAIVPSIMRGNAHGAKSTVPGVDYLARSYCLIQECSRASRALPHQNAPMRRHFVNRKLNDFDAQRLGSGWLAGCDRLRSGALLARPPWSRNASFPVRSVSSLSRPDLASLKPRHIHISPALCSNRHHHNVAVSTRLFYYACLG
jgi:hypothetical protein